MSGCTSGLAASAKSTAVVLPPHSSIPTFSPFSGRYFPDALLVKQWIYQHDEARIQEIKRMIQSTI